MAKKTCPNGHIYNSDMYDECPLCAQGAAGDHNMEAPQNFGMPPFDMQPDMMGGTHVTSPSPAEGQPSVMSIGMANGGADPVGQTHLQGQRPGVTPRVPGGTVIKPAPGMMPTTSGRRLVGFLVTYNRDPMGKAYNLYEGKNYIGRDHSCDVSIPADNQMSGRHMSILYRNVDNKFKFRDEQSSNGTFVNKELTDEGELQNYDIIRLGSTVFIFIAIPKLG